MERFEQGALIILHRLSMEYRSPWWKRMFHRWVFSDEPMRNDAANLLRMYKKRMETPPGVRYVGEV